MSHGRKGYNSYALLTLLTLHYGKQLTLEQISEEEERERHVGIWGKLSGQKEWQVQRPSAGGFLAR